MLSLHSCDILVGAAAVLYGDSLGTACKAGDCLLRRMYLEEMHINVTKHLNLNMLHF